MIDQKPMRETKFDTFTDKSLTRDPSRIPPVKEGVYLREVLEPFFLPDPYKPFMLDPAIKRHRRFIMLFLGWRSKGHARWKMIERAERLSKKKKRRGWKLW